ncbi:MAG TPA: hypothetical protein VEG38_07820 [Acidimicrobiia bacterium]|nr:hypothetical protein [Acidimicrobiia bacterium]
MDRKRLETAAAANHYLRGLLAIPLGVVLVSSGLGNMEWGPFRHLWVVPATVALAVAGYLAVARFYNDNYGRVVLKTGQRRTVAGTAAALTVMIGGPILVQALDLPVNGLGVAWGAAALGYYAMNVGLRPHHMVIWGSVVVVSLVPLWGDPRTTDTPNVGLLIVGAACAATGIFDHRILVRTFGSPGDVGLQNSDVGT